MHNLGGCGGGRLPEMTWIMSSTRVRRRRRRRRLNTRVYAMRFGKALKTNHTIIIIVYWWNYIEGYMGWYTAARAPNRLLVYSAGTESVTAVSSYYPCRALLQAESVPKRYFFRGRPNNKSTPARCRSIPFPNCVMISIRIVRILSI